VITFARKTWLGRVDNCGSSHTSWLGGTPVEAKLQETCTQLKTEEHPPSTLREVFVVSKTQSSWSNGSLLALYAISRGRSHTSWVGGTPVEAKLQKTCTQLEAEEHPSSTLREVFVVSRTQSSWSNESLLALYSISRFFFRCSSFFCYSSFLSCSTLSCSAFIPAA
jgi:hypothetical protein